MKEIRFIITEDGFKVDYQGFIGEQCLKDFEDLLSELRKEGIDLDIKTERKAEYYKQAEVIYQ